MRVRVCPLADVEVASSLRVELEALDLLLAVVRVSDTEVKVIDDTCSHAEYSLSDGPCDLDEMTIECGKHGALFSLLDGTPQSLPATKPVNAYESFIVDDFVEIEVEV